MFGTSKGSEEQKQVTWTDRIASEMALRGSGLPEDWTPSMGARDRIASQVGIEMRALLCLDPAARQVFDQLRD